MSLAAQRALFKAIKERAFDPVYYLYGEDDFLKEEAAKRLVEVAVDPATRDFNLDVRRAPQLEPEALASLLATPPMMADRRVVVVRELDAMKKDTRAALDGYLKAPASDTVLVLVAAGGEKAKADKALADRTTAVEFPPLTPDRVPKWIEHRVTTELGTTIEPAAAALLQSAAGSDLHLLRAELDKLASFTNGAPIDEGAVSAVVGVRRGETLGDLLDRVLARDAGGALALVPHVLELPKTTGVYVVMALTVNVLALAWARSALDRGLAPGRLFGELMALLKGAAWLPVSRPWGEAVRSWCDTVGRWSAASLDHALDALLAADVALKESRVSSEEEILATLVLSLCTTTR